MQVSNTVPHSEDIMPFVTGDGEMAALIRAKDWTKTPLGHPNDWPQPLCTMVSVVLDNPFGMYIAWGREYTQIYNDGYRPILGETKHPHALGKSTCETFSEIWHIIESMFDGVMQGNPVRFLDLMLPLNRNGFTEECYFDFAYSPIRLETGEVGGVLVTVIETTKKKRGEIALKESEERFRNMADNIPNLAWMAHADGGIYWYNKKWYDYTGTTPADMEGWGWQSVHHPDTLDEVLQKWKASILSGEAFEMVFPIKRADGRYGQFLTRVLPMRNEAGEIYQWFGSNTDITAQKETEYALKDSEQRFRTMAESTEILIAVGDETGDAVYFNKAWTKFTGRPIEDLLKYGWADLLHEEDREAFQKIFLNAFEKREPFTGEFRILNAEGVYRWLLAKGPPRFHTDGSFAGYISSCIDITEIKEADEVLRKSAEKLMVILEGLPQMAWTTMPTGEADYFSKKWYDYTGQRKGEALGYGWTNAIDPAYKDVALAMWSEILKAGTHLELETKIKGANGEYRWMWVKGMPLKNEQNEIIQWVGTVTDINERKHFAASLEKEVGERTAEIAQKNAELEKMNKELESFAYISSHDLQEPLRKIQLFSNQIISTEAENLSKEGKDRFERMQRAAGRMQTLINDLLAYSRTSSTERKFEYIDLKVLVKEVKSDLKEELVSKKAVVETNEMCMAYVIPFQFSQLMFNLISNSLKFSYPDKPPHIKITGRVINGQAFPYNKLIPGKNYCHINVTDNGIGFDPQYSQRIFEVFQRLHGRAEYTGTGIGLAIVKKIAESHNGFIVASSEPGNGAAFDIFIPAERENILP